MCKFSGNIRKISQRIPKTTSNVPENFFLFFKHFLKSQNISMYKFPQKFPKNFLKTRKYSVTTHEDTSSFFF